MTSHQSRKGSPAWGWRAARQVHCAAQGTKLPPFCLRQHDLCLQLQNKVTQVPGHLGGAQRLLLSPFKNATSVPRDTLSQGHGEWL